MSGYFSAFKTIGKVLKGNKSKVSPTIKSVKPSVPKTKLEKAKSKLAIAKQKTKGSAAKLKQTLFDIKEKTKKERVYSGKELEQQKYFKDMNKGREKKMGGGMMGRRFGMKKGSNGLVGKQKNIDVAAPFGTINEKDFAKLRAKKKGTKNGKTMS